MLRLVIMADYVSKYGDTELKGIHLKSITIFMMDGKYPVNHK